LNPPEEFIAMGAADPSRFADLNLGESFLIRPSSRAARSTQSTNEGSRPSDSKTLRQQVQALSAVLELVTRVNASDTLDQAASVTAGGLRKWLSASSVDVFWQRKPNGSCQWIARSGAGAYPVQDHDAMRLAAAEEILTRCSLTDSHGLADRDRISLLAVKRYSDAIGARRILGVSLGGFGPNEFDRFGATDAAATLRRGIVLLRFDQSLSEDESTELLLRLDACRQPLFQALTKVRSTELPKWRRWIRSTPGNNANRKRALLLIGISVVAGVLMIPMPYQVPAQCQLQPIGRRYVAAPIAGPLEKVFVRPGDAVDRGDLLARVNPREIEMELAGKRAELQRLKQEQKGQLAQHQFAESKLADLRVQRLRSEMELLEYRRGRMEILAPIDGIVVSGDWKRSEGTLLERGETLFEIAPPGKFQIEVSVDESDVLLLRPGMVIRFRLNAMPARRLEQALLRIHPRSELRDNDNRFLAEANLTDTDGVLQPGMRGSGHVETDAHCIGWNLFHKAYHRLLAMIGG
jgi:hypothetical protein